MRWLAGVIAAIALVAAGCGGTTSAGAGGAAIVPATAPAFIGINVDTDSSQWQTLDDLASRFPDKPKLMKMFTSALEDQNLNWKRDVKPALGPEIDGVWLDFNNDGQDFVVLMKPDDKQKFEKLVKRAEDDTDFFRTEIDGWQVLAPRQDLLDTFRSQRNSGMLADEKRFSSAMKTYPDEYLFRAYVNGDAVMKAARRIEDADFQKMLPKLGRLDWFAMNLRATSDGIRWDTNVHGTPGPAFAGIKPAQSFTPSLSRKIPRNALVYFTFHGTKGMFNGLETNPIFADVPEIKRYSGVFRNIGRLLEGENALYVRPARGGGKIPEITFIAEPRPGTNGAATLDGLIKRYHRQMELPSLPKRKTIGGVDTRVVPTGDDPKYLYYGNVGKRLVISDFPIGITTLAGSPAPITQSGAYNDARSAAGMPDKTQGFVYVNFSGGIGYAQRLMDAPLPGSVKRNLRPLRSAVEYAATRPSEMQVTLFLRIK